MCNEATGRGLGPHVVAVMPGETEPRVLPGNRLDAFHDGLVLGPLIDDDFLVGPTVPGADEQISW
eukprot:CAMPEP_0170170658 /NCGR_PEP_ID=MMETSP0040_2-20121228/3650_1 /TAXON_ID=641309 /ORGANISM="Lotharella oceanica, Strain CCMP622" /LENGTH=64 /DNA_ID=CAMNT_0010410183 /DNA_START=391 /DNA_END=585 /DNA_ORIENTATION=-